MQANKILNSLKNIPKTPHPNGYFKVTLIRSPIGLPPKTRNAVRALGLKKLNHTVFKIRNEVTVGHIFKIKELVKIENVNEMAFEDRSPAKGFQIIGSRLD